jgi:hypothetical protein
LKWELPCAGCTLKVRAISQPIFFFQSNLKSEPHTTDVFFAGKKIAAREISGIDLSADQELTLFLRVVI